MKTESLPPYSVRHSRRARNVLLRILPDSGLEVVVPHGFDARRVPEVVAGRLPWIERHLRRLAETGPRSHRLPTVLDLPAAGLSYTLHTLDAPDAPSLTENAGRLLLKGGDEAARLEALRGFVRRKARAVLPQWMLRLGMETGLVPSAVRIRRQRTRWGSCSRAGVINLNCKLLFLPAPLAEQVLVHELCHLRHPDHSSRFWALVERLRPGGRDLERDLRQSGRHVPAWMED